MGRLWTKLRALRALGAEIIQADLSSVRSLESSFASANAIFVNTDFWGVYRDALAAGKSAEEASVGLRHRNQLEEERSHGSIADSVARKVRVLSLWLDESGFWWQILQVLPFRGQVRRRGPHRERYAEPCGQNKLCLCRGLL